MKTKAKRPIKTVSKIKPVATPVKTLQEKVGVKENHKKTTTDTLKRYSEKDLAQFRKLIMERLHEAKIDNELLKNTLSHTNEHGTEDTSPTFKIMEDGSDVETKEETAHLALRQGKFIQNLQNALVRIENKTYGICRVTGQLIPKERLLSVPHATLSINAKLAQPFNQDTLYVA
jgi:DnaK suppressor protein